MGGSQFPGSMFTKLMRGELPTVALAADGTEVAGRPSGPYSSANMMSGTSSSTSLSGDASSNGDELSLSADGVTARGGVDGRVAHTPASHCWHQSEKQLVTAATGNSLQLLHRR